MGIQIKDGPGWKDLGSPATQAEAEAGTEAALRMFSPLRVAQAIAALAGATAWELKTSNFTAVAGHKYFCDTTDAVFSATLPASPSVGDTVDIVDAQGSFGTHNLNVARNGEHIGTGDSDLILDVYNAAVTFIYVGGINGWQVVRSQ